MPMIVTDTFKKSPAGISEWLGKWAEGDEYELVDWQIIPRGNRAIGVAELEEAE